MTVTDCPFCNPRNSSIVLKNALCYAIHDIAPVTRGHLLIIPYRHVENYFDTTYEEKCSIIALVDDAKALTDAEYSPAGYNIGVNVGGVAGQSIMHTHFHFIPRYHGDTTEIGGGIRRVVSRR
ncbi:MAG: HIT family protein [Methanomicrobiales archaeon]|nr:HIT family protein [Methanomicrobiales archaeon]